MLTGNHTLVVYANDSNSNEARMTAGTSSLNWFNFLSFLPSITVTAPANNSSSTNSTPIVYITAIDMENATMSIEIYANSSNKSYNGSYTNNTSVNMTWNTTADGIYTYYARAYDRDSGSNNVSEGNLTLIVDTTAPTFVQASGSDNNTTVNRTWAFFNFTITDNTYMENTSFQLNNTMNSSGFNYTMTKQGNAFSYTINLSNLQSRNFSYIVYANDSTSHQGTMINGWFAVDNDNPALGNISNQPNDTNDLDPNSTVVNITATATDDLLNITGNRLENVNLEYSYNGTNGHNTTMQNTSSEVWWGTFTANSTANWTYRIFATDSAGKINRSSNATLDVEYDRTWTISPTNLSTISAAIGGNVTIANITLNNTGDYAQNFAISKDAAVVPTVAFNQTAANLSQGRQTVVQVNVTPPTTASTYTMSIKFSADNDTSGSPQANYSNGTLIARGDGPFLFLEIDYSNGSVTQGGTYYINTKVTNYGNETASSVWVAYSVPSDWTGTINNTFVGTITVNGVSWSNTSFSVSGTAGTGTKSVLVYPGFTGFKHNQTSNASTSVVVAAASSTTTVTSGSGVGTGGGGGGGGLSESQKAKLFGTPKIYDLVSGKDKSFPFVVGNPYENGVMEDVSIEVEGLLSKYLRIEPNFVKKIEKRGSYPVQVIFTTPSYFTEGKHTLTFTIKATVIKGVVKTKTTETTQVTLRVHEISTEQAKELINEAQQRINEIKKAGFYSKILELLLAKADASVNEGDYKSTQSIAKQIKEQAESAFTADDKIKALDGQVKEARRLGARVAESSRILDVAKAQFARGDYISALQNVQEAELTYLVETKGYFNLTYAIKSNFRSILAGIIAAVFLGIAAIFYSEKALIDRALMENHREEGILLGLMKTVQRECFEERKMSVTEYSDAMLQYENKLNKVVQKIVELESKKANLIEFGKETAKLRHETKRLIELLKETQKKYIEIGDLETRIYEDKMKSFTARLGIVEERLATIEAQELLAKKRGPLGRVLRALFAYTGVEKEGNE